MHFPKRAGVFAPALFLCAALVLTACSQIPILQSRAERADSVASAYNWTKSLVTTPQFQLATYKPRRRANGSPLNVYIEGDGVAWVNGFLSPDPTPDDPITLKLAVQDPNANTLYLARPCQYLSSAQIQNCNAAYWSSHRYAEDVVNALDEAVSQAKSDSGAQQVRLFGYSGGGTLAVLLAAKRTDVTHITTIAANLDHAMWTKNLGDTPLVGSLNAIEYTDHVKHIPQIHFSGSEDDVVAPSIIAAYQARFAESAPVQHISIDGYDHFCCWADAWPTLLGEHLR